MPADRLLKEYLANFPQKSFGKDAFLVPIDQKLNHLFYLKTGYVNQYSVSGSGQEFIHNIYKPGSIFPLHLALNQLKTPFFFQALSKVEASVIPVDEITDFLQKNPNMLLALTKRLASGLNQLIYRFESLAVGVAQQKIAAALYLLAKRFGSSAKGNLEKSSLKSLQKAPLIINAFPITHQFLANMTSLTRETVSAEMIKFKELKIIDYQSKVITILSPEKLKELSSLPFNY